MSGVSLLPHLLTGVSMLSLVACTLGPDFVPPSAEAPGNWTAWRSGEASLHAPVALTARGQAPWWQSLGDPVLDRLEQQALAASPDLQTAFLHFSQARAERGITAARESPGVDASAALTRQRISEYGISARQVEMMGADRDSLMQRLGKPFNFYQAGVDASWEPDLWGRIRRSIEAADAGVTRQAALLDLARLSLTSDVAQHYFSLRTTQHSLDLLRREIAIAEEQIRLREARMQAGLTDATRLESDRATLASLRTVEPDLQAREAGDLGRLALLLGARPGTLQDTLRNQPDRQPVSLPDLSLGLPSGVAAQRPDIRAAEARLRAATANIGVARADLYPNIRLGTHLGFESYLRDDLADWGSRNWSVGPSLSLPLFDHGRRRRVLQLRQLQQQEAAVAYHQTVLQAWQEIDEALNTYTAWQQRVTQLEARVAHEAALLQLAQARYTAGTVDYLAVLDCQRTALRARSDLAAGQGSLARQYVTVQRVSGAHP